MSELILIADLPSPRVDELMRDLRSERITVVLASSAAKAIALAESQEPGLVLLDELLDGVSNLEVLRALRARGSHAVILLAGSGSEHERIAAFNNGADDYLSKPMCVPELVARIKARLKVRRATVPELSARPRSPTIDFRRQILQSGDALVTLTTHECAILRELSSAEGEPVSRQDLISQIWSEGKVTERVVDFHVTNLRRKYEQLTGEPGGRWVISVHGSGFRLVI